MRFENNEVSNYLDPSNEHSSDSMLFNTCDEEIQTLISQLPNKKSASLDNVTYDHLKHGGPMLNKVITDLFNAIQNTETLPTRFKNGLTVTLYKGHGKPYCEPSSYRAISLLPVISKLFEEFLLNRINKSNIASKVNDLQHVFQKNMNCKKVSLILQEAGDCCCERGSALNVCYMDAKSAFDMLWIDGLLYKLHNMGVGGKTLKCICVAVTYTEKVI